MQAVILAGGFGTRISQVLPKGMPKALAPVGDRRFIDYQLDYLVSQQVTDIVFCIGYLADEIVRYLGTGSERGINITYSRELEPLGTGGAIKNALSLIDDEFVVLNGDSLFEIQLSEIYDFHKNKMAAVTLALTHLEDSSRFGSVEVNGEGQIVSFTEKAELAKKNPLINAGIYIINKRSVDWQRLTWQFSLERDLFPILVKSGRLFGYPFQAPFVDIGIPDDYFTFVSQRG